MNDRDFYCGYCGARPGEPCATVGGSMPGKQSSDHADRIIAACDEFERRHRLVAAISTEAGALLQEIVSDKLIP